LPKRQVWKRVPSVWLFHQVKNCSRKVFIQILAAAAAPAFPLLMASRHHEGKGFAAPGTQCFVR
jgi:hypothetical protein